MSGLDFVGDWFNLFPKLFLSCLEYDIDIWNSVLMRREFDLRIDEYYLVYHGELKQFLNG